MTVHGARRRRTARSRRSTSSAPTAPRRARPSAYGGATAHRRRRRHGAARLRDRRARRPCRRRSRGTSARPSAASRSPPPAPGDPPPPPPDAGHDGADRGLLLGARRRQGLLPPQGAARAERHGLGRPVRAALRPPLDPAQEGREVLDVPRHDGALQAPPLRRQVVLPHRRPGRVELPPAPQAAEGALHHRRDGGGQGVQRVAHDREDPRQVRRALLASARGRPRRRARRGAGGRRAHRAGDGRRQDVRARRPAEGEADRAHREGAREALRDRRRGRRSPRSRRRSCR